MEEQDGELEQLRKEYAGDHSNRDTASRLAQRYCDKGWYNEAEEIFREISAIFPDDYSILLDYGNLCFRRGNLDDAKRMFEKLTILKPGRMEGWNNLGIVHLSREDGESAKNCFARVLEIEPENCGALLNMGNYHDRRGEYVKAIEMFEKTVAVRRDFADGWFNLGNAYLNAGNYQKALESYRRALRISPEFPSAMKNMGYAFEKTGDLDEALVCYNKALAINKTDAMIYVNIASINCRLKKYDKARDFYLKAMQLSPREPAGWMGLRQLSLLKGDIPTYVKSTLAILRRLDDSAVAESLKCLRELKYDTGVEAVIKMADKLDLHTDGVEAERMLFLLRKKSSDVKSRMIYVRLCAVVKPANSIALCLSEYEYLTGKYDAAFARLKKVDAADPSKYRLMWLSAAACGKPAEAEKIAREYLNLHEDCFDAWFMLARICAETGRKQEAKESLVKAIENGFTGTDEISASFELEAIYNSLNM